MPIDYSKWKKIDVSDDEDDTHPNIDTPSLFRWRHQARLEKMAQKEKDRQEIEEVKTKTQREMADIQRRLNEAGLIEESEREKLNTKLSELKKQEEEFRSKETELEKQERLEAWNVDTIGHEGFSKSRINKVEPVNPDDTMTEEEKQTKSAQFYKENRKLIEKYGILRKWDDSKEFLLDNRQLCCEDTANYLTIECLNNEMEEKHELMEHIAHQAIVMNFLLELSKELKYSPQAPQLISMFFDKLKKADKAYQDAFEDELRMFKERIVARAKEKVAKAVQDYEEEERKKRLGPGGLDPLEVLETLPLSMKRCFEEKDIGGLQAVAMEMSPEEFRNHLKRCIDSGLWLPEGNKNVGDDQGDGDGDEEHFDNDEPDKSEEPKETELRKRNTATSSKTGDE